MYIRKKINHWPALFGITQGGADFSRLDSFETSLSGIKVEFKMPYSVIGNLGLARPPKNLNIFDINWDECYQKSADQYFDEKKIAINSWQYWGNFHKTGFHPIGYLRMEWQLSRFDKKHHLKSLDSSDVIDYLKKHMFEKYETGDGYNIRLRERANNEYKDKNDPASYQDLVDAEIKRYTIKHPDDYKEVIINDQAWTRFSGFESRKTIFHLLPLTNEYFLINDATFYSDFRSQNYRWFPEAEKIIETVMTSTTVKFPDGWEY